MRLLSRYFVIMAFVMLLGNPLGQVSADVADRPRKGNGAPPFHHGAAAHIVPAGNGHVHSQTSSGQPRKRRVTV